MIRADKLTLRRGSKVLLENTSFIIHAGERVGVVGKNGAGKSSLFALLQGQLEPDSGQLSIASQWQIATVEQHIRQANRVAREFVIDGDQHLRHLQEQRAA
ncbi:MAG TPA: ATP-binding cassette domain-containing protein, partial [Burkholderiaceae bacterium]|nr:ATP-binding cassette domain-containing protein [Burkholderiaceae bacterium]